MPSPPSEDPTFFTGIDTSISAIAPPNTPQPIRDQLLKLEQSISSATNLFDPHTPAAIAPQLADALSIADRLIANIDSSDLPPLDKANILHELRIKRVQLNDALALALGLTLDATTSGADQTTGAGVVVLARLTTASASPLTIENEWLQNAQSPADPPAKLTREQWQQQAQQAYAGAGNPVPDPPGHETIPDLAADRPVTRSLHAKPRDTSIPTRPYFSRDSIETPVYTLHNPNLRNAPSGPPAFTARAILDYRGLPIQLARIVHDGPQPLQLVPAGSLSLSAHAQVLPNDRQSVLIKTFLYPIEKPAVTPKLSMPLGWKSHIAISDVYGPGGLGFDVDAPTSHREVSTIKASATLSTHETITEGYRPIGYGDLPRTNFYTPATTRIVPVDLKLPARQRIAYLSGTGDAVPEALASIHLTPTLLTVADLTPTNLAKYDTVILGVRTYAAHPDLHGAPTAALLDYARNGGNVVVQYQTPEFTAADAPYPLSLGSNEKVVDETAPIQLLDSAAPLLNQPNLIAPSDFNNWVEERGHGFLSTWDDHYTALTETHDPGQLPQRGGLITTPLGRGRWTYVAFALYRQLPEAVPGAYRLFLDLLNAR